MLDLRAIAKVDLHRHLEGSLRPATLLDIFRTHGMALPALTAEALAEQTQVRAPMADLLEVLAAFGIFQRAFVSPAVAERLAYEAVEDAARENVRLLELRFSPEFMAAPHQQDPDALTAAVIRGARRAEREYGSAVGLIAIVSRSYRRAHGGGHAAQGVAGRVHGRRSALRAPCRRGRRAVGGRPQRAGRARHSAGAARTRAFAARGRGGAVATRDSQPHRAGLRAGAGGADGGVR